MAFQGDTRGANRPMQSRDNRAPVILELPENYLKYGYYSNDSGSKRIRSEYVVQYAEDIAKKLCVDPKGGFKQAGMGRSQIYGFYEEVVKALNLALKQKDNVGQAIANIELLVSKAVNSRTKGNAPELFVKFIRKNAEELKDLDDIKAFKTHFEAIMGFYPKSK